jgi:general secretion pathway protein D
MPSNYLIPIQVADPTNSIHRQQSEHLRNRRISNGTYYQELFANIGSSNVNVVLSALQAVTNVRVISSPYLTVLDGKPARLSIGDEVPFLTASTEASNDGTTTTTNQIEVRETGIILDVTPRVGADNSVVLTINQEVSSVAPGGAQVNELTPTIQQRTIQSDILVKSGRTALLGGLIQDSNTRTTTKVPVVGDIPVLGGLFKQNNNELVRTELLVMITPRVVRKPSQLEHITRQLRGSLASANN